MRNYIIGLIFIVILPASFSSSDSSGCNKKKSACTEKKSEKSEQIKKEKKKSENKGQKSAKNDVACFPFLSIE